MTFLRIFRKLLKVLCFIHAFITNRYKDDFDQNDNWKSNFSLIFIDPEERETDDEEQILMRPNFQDEGDKELDDDDSDVQFDIGETTEEESICGRDVDDDDDDEAATDNDKGVDNDEWNPMSTLPKKKKKIHLKSFWEK